MTPGTKLVLVTLVCAILSCISFFAFLKLFFAAVVGLTLVAFDRVPVAAILAVVGYLGSRLSFLICPLAAFYCRDLVFEFTPSLALRGLIFFVMSISGAVFTGLAFLGLKARERHAMKGAIEEHRLKMEFADRIKNAGIIIQVISARAIAYEKDFATVEVTLQITNLPDLQPEYRIDIYSGVPNREGLLYNFYDESTQTPYAGSITARNENGRWSYYLEPSGAWLGSDDGPVAFRLRVENLRKGDFPLNTTIKPRVMIWLNEDTGLKNYPVWQRPVAISIERNIDTT